jgi:hypothetical protein
MYSGLLVSLHGTGLFSRFRDRSREAPHETRSIDQFMSAQQSLQQQWIAALRRDRLREGFCDEQVLERNRRLIAAWDWMSLNICMEFDETVVIEQVPARDGRQTVAMTMSTCAALPDIISVDPWPFRDAQVSVTVEGRRLVGRFNDQDAMRSALQEAAPVTMTTQLVRRM